MTIQWRPQFRLDFLELHHCLQYIHLNERSSSLASERYGTWRGVYQSPYFGAISITPGFVWFIVYTNQATANGDALRFPMLFDLSG